MRAERREIIDPLYGHIELSPNQVKLIATKEIQRLEKVSLSAVPPLVLSIENASRLDHSIGVMHLANIVCQKPEFEEYKIDLPIAALAHDMASPPFSHLSERFLTMLYKINHEELLAEVISGSEFERVTISQSASIENIINLVNGNLKPISDVLNGTMDIDNLDNTQRYGLTAGLIPSPLYSPERLARAYTIVDGQIAILPGHREDIANWEKCRQIVYEYVYGIENMTMSSMIHRAIDFAVRQGEIAKEFFRMTDTQAFEYLLTQCNPKTRELMEVAKRKQPYAAVVDVLTFSPSDILVNLAKDPANRAILADKIAKELNIKPQHICVYLGKTKTYKKVDLRILDEEKGSIDHQPTTKQSWVVQVHLHPNALQAKEKVKVLANVLIGLN